MENAPLLELGIGNQKQWYDIQFERAQLNEADASWLISLHNGRIDQAWLQEANKSIAVGSISLVSSTDPETFASVMKERERFFAEQLGWDNADHPLHDPYQKIQDRMLRIIPLTTFIESQRAMSRLGIDGARVLSSQPVAISYGPARIAYNVASLEALGIKAAKAINTFPSLLQYSAEAVKAKMDNLAALGINAVKAVNNTPGILASSPQAMQAKVHAMSRLGIDAGRLNKAPELLFLSESRLEQRVMELEALGVDAAKAINTFPRILGISSEKLRSSLATLAELGINPTYALKAFPAVVGLADASIRAKVNHLNALGIDAIGIINRDPVVLGFAPETVARKVNFINRYIRTLGWKNGTAQSLIEASPVILKLSEKKLRAHTRIFANYGRPDMTVEEVRTLLINPLDTHMLALNSGIEYGKPAINAIRARVAPKERPDKARVLINDAAFTALVGHKIIDAYMAYANDKVKVAP